MVQKNLYNGDRQQDLLDILEKYDIPHDAVEIKPHSYHLPVEERMIPFVNPTGQVMVCGALSFADIARQMNWTSGSFHNENHDYRVWQEHY